MIGVEELGLSFPRYYVDCEELAKHRGVDPSYPIEGLGVKRFRVLCGEDLVSLAVRACEKVSLEGVRMVYVATESSSDLSKPIGVKVVKELGLNAGTVELKFACVSSSYALMEACNFASVHGKPCLVIAVDEALYEKGSTAEFTNGCGAAAVRVGGSPALQLSFHNFGCYTDDVDDFYKPAKLDYPVVDGKLSIVSYIYALGRAYEDWTSKNRIQPAVDFFDRFVFHVPFPKMVLHAFAAFYARDKGIGRTYHLSDVMKNPQLYDAWRLERKKISETAEFKSVFDLKVSKGLELSSIVGNCYTASILVSLASLLAHDNLRAEDRIAFGAYGSGMGALAYWGTYLGLKPKGVEEAYAGEKLSPDEFDELKHSRGADLDRWRSNWRSKLRGR